MSAEIDAKKIELSDKLHAVDVKLAESRVLNTASQNSDEAKAAQAKQREIMALRVEIKALQEEIYG